MTSSFTFRFQYIHVLYSRMSSFAMSLDGSEDRRRGLALSDAQPFTAFVVLRSGIQEV